MIILENFLLSKYDCPHSNAINNASNRAVKEMTYPIDKSQTLGEENDRNERAENIIGEPCDVANQKRPFPRHRDEAQQ